MDANAVELVCQIGLHEDVVNYSIMDWHSQMKKQTHMEQY